MAESTVHTFEDITARLDEIITTVRSKDTSLERSLDLFDEAISLGSKAVELVDSFDMSPTEAAMLEEASEVAKAENDADAADDARAEGKSVAENADRDASSAGNASQAASSSTES